MLETIGGLSEFGSVISKERLGSYTDRISSLKKIELHRTSHASTNQMILFNSALLYLLLQVDY